MAIQKIKYLALSMLLLSSCVIVNTPGFYSGYRKLSDAQKQQVHFAGSKNATAYDKGAKIYAVTGQQLRTRLQQHDSTIVYMWSPQCHSDVCIAPNVFSQLCTARNYHCVIVTEYYDFDKLKNIDSAVLPVYAVNHRYYKTQYCNRYTRVFTRDLLAGSTAPYVSYHRFLFFHGDSFVRSARQFALN